MSWYEDPVLGSDIMVYELLIALGIFTLGVLLSIWFPRLIARNVTRFYLNIEERSLRKDRTKTQDEIASELQKSSKKFRKTLELPLKRSLVGLYIVLFFILSVLVLNIEMDTTFLIRDNDYEVWRMVQSLVILIVSSFVSLFFLDPILRATLYAVFGDKVSKSSKYRLYRKMRTPVKSFFIVLGLYLALFLSFTNSQLIDHVAIRRVLYFFLTIFFTWSFAHLIALALEPRFREPGKRRGHAGKAIGRLAKALIFVLGGLAGMLVLGLDPLTIATSLGLIGFALAFGLQDTVANFAAGIMISIDRPFVIGDRIRIHWEGQETWGDVRDISLRSTWIKTPEGEMIVVPNNLIATSQVWNYTRESPKLALHFEVGISYDSDWKFAERIILDLLKKHPMVLSNPPPYILMKDFSDSAMELTVWFWIPEARDKRVMESDIRKRIKDAFDANGIEIPFPYRTIVYKTDLEKPHRMKESYDSPLYLPSMGYKKMTITSDSGIEIDKQSAVILAPTSAPYAAKFTAPYVMEIAKKMGAALTALYIKSPGSDYQKGQRALRIYNEMATIYGVDIKLRYEEGDVLEKILDVVEEEEATLVVMGSAEETIFGSIARRNISQELMKHLNIPTMIIPFKRELEDKYKHIQKVEAAGDHLPEGIPPESLPPPKGDFSTLSKLERIGIDENSRNSRRSRRK
ncbi:MAG: mechanosensitive ion channel domain-containing protein [Thermoplasmatota archaeon]